MRTGGMRASSMCVYCGMKGSTPVSILVLLVVAVSRPGPRIPARRPRPQTVPRHGWPPFSPSRGRGVSGFAPPYLERPGRQLHQQGLS